jgi:hypothetical protein
VQVNGQKVAGRDVLWELLDRWEDKRAGGRFCGETCGLLVAEETIGVDWW